MTPLRVGDVVTIKDRPTIGIVIAIDTEGVKLNWISAPREYYYRNIHPGYDYFAGATRHANKHIERIAHVSVT